MGPVRRSLLCQLVAILSCLFFGRSTFAAPLNEKQEDTAKDGKSTLVNMHEVTTQLGDIRPLPTCAAIGTRFQASFTLYDVIGYYQVEKPMSYCFDIFWKSPPIAAPILHCDGPTPEDVHCVKRWPQSFDGYVGLYVRNSTELWVRIVGTAAASDGKNTDEEGKIADVTTTSGVALMPATAVASVVPAASDAAIPTAVVN